MHHIDRFDAGSPRVALHRLCKVVHIANITNGERLTTYAIRAPFGSRVVCSNGAAAHKVHVGDRIIIFGFALCAESEIPQLEPKLVFVDDDNNPFPGPARETFGY